MSDRRAEIRRMARVIYGYRGKKAKRRRRLDPRVVRAFEERMNERLRESEQNEAS